jgi:Tfp pilus assembly protein PilF
MLQNNIRDFVEHFVGAVIANFGWFLSVPNQHRLAAALAILAHAVNLAYVIISPLSS